MLKELWLDHCFQSSTLPTAILKGDNVVLEEQRLDVNNGDCCDGCLVVVLGIFISLIVCVIHIPRGCVPLHVACSRGDSLKSILQIRGGHLKVHFPPLELHQKQAYIMMTLCQR